MVTRIHPVHPIVERKKNVYRRPILLDKIPPSGLLTMAEAMYMAPIIKVEYELKNLVKHEIRFHTKSVLVLIYLDR